MELRIVGILETVGILELVAVGIWLVIEADAIVDAL